MSRVQTIIDLSGQRALNRADIRGSLTQHLKCWAQEGDI